VGEGKHPCTAYIAVRDLAARHAVWLAEMQGLRAAHMSLLGLGGLHLSQSMEQRARIKSSPVLQDQRCIWDCFGSV